MLKIVTVEQMRAIEQAGDAAGISYDQMMDSAGRALADRVLALLDDQPGSRITVLAGAGNNGGDALVAARLIAAESDHEVNIYLTKPRDPADRVFAPIQEAGLFVVEASKDQRYRVLDRLIGTSHMIIDGVLGIGLRLPIEGDLAKFLAAVQKSLRAARQARPAFPTQTPAMPVAWADSGPYVIAVDCPSGLDCDTGEVGDLTIPADETVTFGAVKRGQVLFPGAGLGGALHVADIGLPKKLPARDAIKLEMPTGADIRALLPPLPPDAHKGTFGKVLVVAGSMNYTGAAALAAEAAYRAGAGLVTVATPQPIMPILAAQVPEATWLLLPHDMGVIAEDAALVLQKELAGYSALLMGPGWGREESTGLFLAAMLNDRAQQEARHRRIGFAPGDTKPASAAAGPDFTLPPLVIDADGLNLLGELDEWWKLLPAGTILTPHPGEMGRLTGLSRDEVQARRLELAVEKAVEWRCVVVLKGAFTVIGAPDGRTVVLPFAEPALATAGTGDVLAGTIAGLLGQGMSPFDAAVAGGYLHGLAGHFAAEALSTPRSVIAHDVLNALSEAVSIVEHAV